MTQEKCYSCGGKGTYSQMHGIYGAEDFCKRDGFTEKPSIHNYQCNSCEGTGLKKVMTQDSRTCPHCFNLVCTTCDCKCHTTQDWKETINERLDSAIKYNWEGGFERKFFVGYVELLLKEERNAVLNRAWEYVVKASREEHGSKEDFIKFVNEYE